MNRLIVNMAVVKVNWDQSASAPFLDNYLPLVLHALKELESDEISTHEFKIKFEAIADFRIPQNVILVLLNRVIKKYEAIKKSRANIYIIDRDKLPESNYLESRHQQERLFRSLLSNFSKYCLSTFNISMPDDEASQYFFEVLYQIAPRLFSSAMAEGQYNSTEYNSQWKYGYLVSRFISYANECDQQSLDIILSFVRGAMLTETFYYQAPEDIQSKFRDISVYLDTSLLLDIFGFAEDTQCIPAKELVDMLKQLSVPLYCFQKTRGEIDSILHATSLQSQRIGRVKEARPGSVGDYFNSMGYSSSDIEIERNRIDSYLEKYGITVIDPPAYLGHYGIDEQGLDAAIKERIPYQADDSRHRDIDCIAAIYRIRQGKIKRSLLDCKAIFVTKNNDLASSSTKFFNNQYGHSDTPLCIPDQVFTTLVWLKTAKKAPDLPRERIVANCFTAMQPSEDMWRRYAAEAKKLFAQGTITESDYNFLVYSTDSRLHLMNLTLGDSEKIIGTVQEVLERSRKEILNETIQENRLLLEQKTSSEEALTSLKTNLKNRIHGIISPVLYVFSYIIITYGFFSTWPKEMNLLSLLPILSISFFTILTFSGLIHGISLKKTINSASNYLSLKVAKWLES